MGIPQRVRSFLESKSATFEVLPHSEAFTAQEVAHSLHVSGKRLAKTVVLKADGKLILTVLPASHRLNRQQLQSTLGASRLEMVPESELASLFPDCELGAIPPFGNLYGVEVWVDRALSESEEIVFCAGTHVDCIRMKYADFARIVNPRLGSFSEVWASKAA